MGKCMSRRRKKKTSRELMSVSSGVVTHAKSLSPHKQQNPHKFKRSLRNLVADNEEQVPQQTESKHADQQASFGDNTLEIQGRVRTSRETTPSSLIRDPDTIKTPGSSAKSTTKSTRPAATKYKVLNGTPMPIPSTSEVDEFFMGPERQQQQLFIEKYNFDPVNDKPLHGRYEWVKLDGTKKS